MYKKKNKYMIIGIKMLVCLIEDFMNWFVNCWVWLYILLCFYWLNFFNLFYVFEFVVFEVIKINLFDLDK